MGGVASRLACDSPGATQVAITYTKGEAGDPITEEFDFLVVACDPRGLNLADSTAFEKEFVSSLTSHTFHTSLISAKRPNRDETVPEGLSPNGPPQTNYAVRFEPNVLEAMDGGVYGFRDEVMARDADFQPSGNGDTWAVTYQLEDTGLLGRDKDTVEKELNVRRDKEIVENGWIDWDMKEKKAAHEITVDYFAHFEQEGLKAEMPWKVVDIQGENKTLYIASFSAFESVLHCYLYQNMLMKRRDVTSRFPRNRNARIAVIGAGPAGLLFASQHLVAKGYTNFKIFESAATYGGKTVTKYQPVPAGADGETVPCELGTCYLSPAYFPMYNLFKRYNAGEVLALDRDSNAFRSIIDAKVAKNAQERDDGVEYSAWSGYRKRGLADAEAGEQAIVRAGVLYLLYHVSAMGMDPEDPLPEGPPSTARVIRNVLSIVKWIVTNIDGISDVVETFSLSTLLKGIMGSGGLNRGMDECMKEDCQLFEEEVRKFDLDIDLGDILRLFTIDLFKVTFEEFLDLTDMGALKPTLVYAYQGMFRQFALVFDVSLDMPL